MTETDMVDSLQDESAKKAVDTMSQSEDVYAPEEPTPDIPISLLDIQMPETPESTKGQISDGDMPRLESPRLLKPVLGKVQAKKRLMAFVNKFNVLPKVPNKSALLQAHSVKASKTKTGDEKSLQNDLTTGLNVDSDSVQHFHSRHSGSGKSKKKTEEKILAIEEIRREESKSKMLLAEAMAAASLEEENFVNRNGQNLLENVKSIRDRNKQNDNLSRKSGSKSSMENKYSERRRYGREERRDSRNRESKDYNSGRERYYKDRDQRRKEKSKKEDKNKGDDETRYEESRDRREDERDRKDDDKDRWEDVREKKGAKEKRESVREKRSLSREKSSEVRDKKEKEKERDKDKGKERDTMNLSSWLELKKCGITMDDIIEIRRRDYSDRSVKNRTAEDYIRYFDQMLLLNDCRMKRYAFTAEGLDGPKEYPPESVRVTKRGRPQMFYSENPRMSLFLSHEQILQAVAGDRREKMREICDTDIARDNAEVAEKPARVRNWYPKAGICKASEKVKWQFPVNVQLPRSKWDSEDEDRLSNEVEREIEEKKEVKSVDIERGQETFSSRSSVLEEDSKNDKTDINEDTESCVTKDVDDDNRQSTSPLLQSAGDEKLASEYEQFMKMVCTDIPTSNEFSPKTVPTKSTTPLSYHDFNIEINLPEDNNFAFTECGEKPEKDDTSNEDTLSSKETRQNVEVPEVEEDQASATSSHIQVQQSEAMEEKSESDDSRSIPSDWENVRIKVERLSDENSDSREVRKKKRRKKMASSSDSSSTTSSSDSEEEVKKRRRKRKLSADYSSVSDSNSSESSSSSSDSSSSDDKRKKRRRKKRRAEKRKKKAKRITKTKKKRRRKVSVDSSNSDSSDNRKKKKSATKKAKEKQEHVEKENENGGMLQKSPLQPSTPIKKIKEERKAESRKRSVEKHDIWTKKQELMRNVISEGGNKAHKDEEKRDKPEERYLEEWEVDSVIMTQQKDERVSKSGMDKIETVEGDFRKVDKKDERVKKDERSKKDERLKEKCSVIAKEIAQPDTTIEEEIDLKKKKKKDKEKKDSNEFLDDWEKLEKQKKEKWGETEFDTLNVLSLTQLEREVSKRQLLADEWEVDSLEAVPDLLLNKKKPVRTSKKVEKEVRYDKKTDTYIAIDKETSRECKKRQDRLSAMRIWEEEQEEGEREAMMLMEQKHKRKRDEWDIDETYLHEKAERKESIEENISAIDSIHKEVNATVSDVEACTKHDVIAAKKNKKSRWDISSQAEEKVELKAPVMWEEECAEWTKLNKFDRKSDELERADTILPKTKIKDEEVDQQSRKSASKGSDFIDLFSRKSQDDLLETPWNSEEPTRGKSRRKSTESSSQRDIFFNKDQIPPTTIKDPHTAEQLKDMFEIDVKLSTKSVELYSPSSPAPSQKSEDVEQFGNDNSSSLSLKESLTQDKLKKESAVLSDEETISNIPLQIKYREGKYSKSSMMQEEFEEILGLQTDDQSAQKMFLAKGAEPSLADLPINEPCPDTSNYKPLQMDIFAEYESDESRSKLSAKSTEAVPSNSSKGEESMEAKAALKLIPKQLLIRRNNERVKPKLISDDPMQHAAALLTIQKKLRESHAVRNDMQSVPCEVSASEFKIECEKTATVDTLVADVASAEQTIDAGIKIDSKDLSSTAKTLIVPSLVSPGAGKVDFNRDEESKSSEKGGSKEEDFKKSRFNVKDVSDIETQAKSPNREQRKRSPSKKENEKRVSDRGKEKRDKKFDDRERSDRRDSRSSKQDYSEKRRSSPSNSRRRRRSVSPRTSWERERSRSESHSRSWSRSRSKSPKRKDGSFFNRDRRSSRVDEDRSRSKTDDRRERSTRTPPRSNTASYNKDHFKKYGSSKDRDDWNRRKYDSMERDREKEGRPYDPMEVLRERNADAERHREARFRGEETDRSYWPYESENIPRDGNESLESYPNGQDLDLDYEEKVYYRDDSIERDIMEGPLRSASKFSQRRSRSGSRRDRQWEKDRESVDLDRHGHSRRPEKPAPLRGRNSPRPRRSSPRLSHDRFRRGSRSRSRSWSRSRSRSRTRSRSRSTSRSRSMRSRSRSRSRSGSRSRTRSTSGSRLRSPDHGLRMPERLRSSRSPSVGRGRAGESSRERKDEHDNRKLDSCGERGRRIETIVQSVSGLARDSAVLDSEMHMADNMETVAAGFQYPNENEVGNEYYYSENNLTYPPCIDDSATSSPKRLSLDDRLELELGIKKQQDTAGVASDYPDNFNSNVCYSSSPQQQQQMLYRQQPTVLQVGNVLQVVPADFNGVPVTHREPTSSSTIPIVRGSSQVVRVGNVLQVVPTSLDWSGAQPSTVEQPAGIMYSATVPQPSPVPVAPISVPVPVPVPMPVPVPSISSSTPVPALSPVALPLVVPVPVPGPVPLPVTPATFPRTEVPPPKTPVQPVYNYEVILETRRKEREERKRLREMRRKEKERRRIERINRRALRMLEKSTMRQTDSGQPKSSSLDPAVLKALRETEEQTETEEQPVSVASEKDEGASIAGLSASTEEEDVPVDDDEEEEEEEEPEVEDDEEDEEEPEDDEDEDEEDDEKSSSRISNRRTEVDDAAVATTSETSKVNIETESKEWPELPPPPLKGILVAPGFRRSLVPNGNLDDLSTPENESDDNAEKDWFDIDKINESNKEEMGENKSGKSKTQVKIKSKSLKLSIRKRSKKSVQFADGIKPGEGTSPSGGEGDMPSPPPPTAAIARDGVREIRRSSSRKSRKQEKRSRPPKAKKKVKVKIIKLKKPRVTPLTAMMMDDSDELDDRSPPPPPPGSPPPPHLWPSYLSAYNSITRPIEVQPTPPIVSNAVQAPPPPTPLPLLIPPPPLNYTIQPCSKA